ncbi:MAG: NHLP family bacteriocin export ABC transporter permease/ATPase subunit, partial [Butyrivibrio sp.]|nr:NHLP family bacteriocin export ABC transporter permease/ATPase subunit [Butyrivibrio sp.]
MGWFDEQIKLRKQNDEDAFAESFINIAGAVLGTKASIAMADERKIAKNAIDTILKYYHIKPGELPDGIDSLEDQLEYLMRPYGIMRRNIKLTKGWYKDAVGAMLGRKKSDGTPVAFIPVGMHKYVYTDETTGKKLKITKDNEDEFEEGAIVFYKPLPLREIGIKDLVVFMCECLSKTDVAMTLLATAAVTGIGLLLPVLNNIVFSELVFSRNLQLFYGIFICMVCIGISRQLFITVKSMMMTRINTKMDINVQSAVMMRLLSLPADFFNEYAAGELSAKMEYLQMFCEMIVSTVFSTVISSIFS